MSVNLDGSDLKQHHELGVQPTRFCSGVSISQDTVYFVCSSSTSFDLLSCSLPACVSPIVVRSNLGNFAGTVAADPSSNAVYVGRGTELGMPSGGSIFDGRDGGRIGNVAQPDPYDMTVSRGFVYWLNRGTYTMGDPDAGDAGPPDMNGGVKRARVGESTEAAVTGANGYYDNNSLAVDDLNVYYATRRGPTETEVVYAPLSGGAPTTFSRGGSVSVVAADNTHVFFDDDSAAGVLRYCPRTGCGPDVGTALADRQGPLRTIVTDDRSVIWATRSGAIRRVPKP